MNNQQKLNELRKQYWALSNGAPYLGRSRDMNNINDKIMVVKGLRVHGFGNYEVQV